MAELEEPVAPVVHDLFENLDLVSYITQTRIYDALIVLLRNINPTEAEALVEAHSKGILLAPPPAMIQE